MKSSHYPVLLGLFALIAAASCSGPTKEEQAVERLRQRQISGFVRVVNLTAQPTDFVVGGKTLMANVGPEKSSVFFATPSGTAEVGSKVAPKPVSVPVKAKEWASVYLVAHGDAVMSHIVTGEPRIVPEKKALVTFVLADSGAYRAKPEGGAEMTLEPFKPSEAIEAAGDFRATVTGPDGAEIPVQIRTQDHGAYTVAIFLKDGKPAVTVLNNHPDLNVTAAGTAAG